MLRTMTLDARPTSMWPWSSAPHRPTMVLFEPMLNRPVSLPITYRTRAVVPPALVVNAAAVVTITGVAVPPPVVGAFWPIPLCEAQPMSVPSAGGAVPAVVLPPLPPVPAIMPPVPAPLPPAPCALVPLSAQPDHMPPANTPRRAVAAAGSRIEYIQTVLRSIAAKHHAWRGRNRSRKR